MRPGEGAGGHSALDVERHRRGLDRIQALRRGASTAHGFFAGRRPVEIDRAGTDVELLDYPNVNVAIGAALASGKASYRDLDAYLSVEDMYDLLEVAAVDAHNARLLNPRDED